MGTDADARQVHAFDHLLEENGIKLKFRGVKPKDQLREQIDSLARYDPDLFEYLRNDVLALPAYASSTRPGHENSRDAS